MQSQPVGRSPACRRGVGRCGAAVAKHEKLRVKEPVAQGRMHPALEALGPDDVGHAGGLNPDLGGDAGIEVGGAGEEPRFAGAVVAATLPVHGRRGLARIMLRSVESIENPRSISLLEN